MKLTNEQLSKLLREQAGAEQRPLTATDIDAYTQLFESLAQEALAANQEQPVGLLDEVMAEIVLLQEKKDRRTDALNLILGVGCGLIAIAVFYYVVDLPRFKAALLWLWAYLPIIGFAILAVCAIQFADRKWVWKR
ncbi:hypothetical protein SAMN05660226_02833 [Parapedobacter luteus]|uniref:Uncharacterized protein n=1 Tax=Parapedobacter luteus TaxID=623280 RepID=A0A1T5DM24_9SPHI|nr:hypothetical protein [Parapedobacter luteus]SKB72754.1 hypothetical protein SAMN05660226_02833 [Parapedobacter luteus]